MMSSTMANGLAYGEMTAPRPERTRTISGKLVLLALLITACLVPFVTWATLRKVERDMAISQPPLSWAQRAAWPTPPIKVTTLERSRLNYGGYHPAVSKWKSLDFAVSPGVETMVKRAAALAAVTMPDAPAAADADAFTSDAVRAELEQLAAEHPDEFYPPYLLGSWHRLRGDQEQADAWYEKAFALAPAVIKLRYVDAADHPMRDLPVGTIEVTCDRVIDDPATEVEENVLDQTLKLVYPDLVTDKTGSVYLPCFHTVYRMTAWPPPPGYKAQHRVEGWFEFPGRIGSPKPTIVWKAQ